MLEPKTPIGQLTILTLTASSAYLGALKLGLLRLGFLACLLLGFSNGAQAADLNVKSSPAPASAKTNIVLERPAGLALGDAMVAFLTVKSTSSALTVPSGWALVRSTTIGTTGRLLSYYKIATSADLTTANWTWGTGTNIWAAGNITAISGAQNPNPIDGAAEGAVSSTTSVTIPSLTTTVTNTLLFGAVATTFSNPSTTPAAWTEIWDHNNATGNVSTELAYSPIQASAGASGSSSASLAASAASGAIAQTVAVAPDPGGPTLSGAPTATAGTSRVNLSWAAATDADLVAYRIYRSEDGISWPLTPIGTSVTNSFTDNALQAPGPYYYRIGAVDWHGQEATGNTSNSVSPTYGNLLQNTAGSNLDLLNEANLKIVGASDDDRLGRVVKMSDLNNDGLSDLMLLASHTDANNRADSGSAYVVWGSRSLRYLELSNLGGNGYRIDGPVAGATNIGTTQQITSLSDSNGDGLSEILLGMPGIVGSQAGYKSGSVYVIWGKTSGTPVDLASFDGTQTTGYKILGEGSDTAFGSSVADMGDINGDDISDFAVAGSVSDFNGRANSGSVWMFWGKNNNTNSDIISATNYAYRIDGGTADESFGQSIANAGDINGDGLDDLVAGGYGWNSSNASLNNGRAFIIWSKTTGGDINLNTATDYGYQMTGSAAGQQVGMMVDGVGDMNGDNIPDVILGAPGADLNSRTNSGSAFVVWGKTTTTSIALGTYTEGFRIDGMAANGQAGFSVSRAGDFNRDGIPDVTVGGHLYANNSRATSGSAWLIYGKTSSTTVDTNAIGSGGLRLDGPGATSQLGVSTDGGEDFNGDGNPDIVTGGNRHDELTRTDNGIVDLIFGTSASSSNYGAPSFVEGMSSSYAPIRYATGSPVFSTGSLPAGLNLNADSGVISGTPTLSSVRANYSVAFKDLTTDSIPSTARLRVYTSTSYPKAILTTSGRYAWWRLGENGGTDALDHLGLNPGKYIANPTLGTATTMPEAPDDDTSIALDGTQMVKVADHNGLDLTRNWSLEAWVKISSTGTDRAIIGKAGAYWLAYDGVQNQFEVSFKSGANTYQARGGAGVVANRLYHVVGTYDGANLVLYVNGQSVATTPQTLKAARTTTPLYLGALTAVSEFWMGNLDEVAIYKTALPATTVTAHWQAHDTIPPDTSITTSPPSYSNQTTPSFSFSSPDATATFKCSLDGAAYIDCGSPHTTAVLAEGSHTFRVKALDVVGNQDASPASYSWTVDTTAPTTSFISTPANPDPDTTPTFEFSSNETATFKCSLDGAAYIDCSSPHTTAVLTGGAHDFKVYAIDQALNQDATPASYGWTVGAAVLSATFPGNFNYASNWGIGSNPSSEQLTTVTYTGGTWGVKINTDLTDGKMKEWNGSAYVASSPRIMSAALEWRLTSLDGVSQSNSYTALSSTQALVTGSRPATDADGVGVGVTFNQPVSYADVPGSVLGANTYRIEVTYDASAGF